MPEARHRQVESGKSLGGEFIILSLPGAFGIPVTARFFVEGFPFAGQHPVIFSGRVGGLQFGIGIKR